MTLFWTVLLLVILARVALIDGLRWFRRRRDERQRLSAHDQLQVAARAARRQMNIAAGQSWRNLAE